MPQLNRKHRRSRVRAAYNRRMMTSACPQRDVFIVMRRLLVLLAIALAAAVHAQDQPGAGGVPDTLQQRIASCTACHGVHGEGSPGSDFFPRLAGKPAGYLALQLQNFRDGLRKYAPMEYTVRQLSPDYMREIASYFATQQVPYAHADTPNLSPAVLARGEQLVTVGDATLKIPACQSCHGKQLTGVEPAIPGLVGLPYDYISSQLGSWRTGTRASPAPDCMAQVANRLAPADITAVSAWLSSHAVPPDTHAQVAGSIHAPLACGVLDNKGSGA